MKKKRLLLTIGLLLVVAVAIGILVMITPRPGVTKANFDRIQDGMTLAEVREIFGREELRSISIGYGGGPRFWKVWREDGSVQVPGPVLTFLDDRVVDKQWLVSSETLLQKLQRWLHL